MGERRLGATGLFCVALLATACGGSADEAVETTTTTTTEAPATTPPTTVATTTSTTEPEPVLVIDELEDFESRSVVYSNIVYQVTGVRVSNQELRSYPRGGEPVIDEGNFHAFLDITAVNEMSTTMSQSLGAAHYRLRLDGVDIGAAEQMGFLSDVAGLIRASTGVDSFLAFPVEEGTDLTSAELLIGVPPERIAVLPLTGAVPEPAYPVMLQVEGSAEGQGPTNPGTVVFTVMGAVLYEDQPHERATSPTGHRANEDELFLVVHVLAEKASGGPDLMGRDGFRLIVDGVPRAPWDAASDPRGSQGSPTLSAGSAVDVWVAFLISVEAEEFVLQVGNFEQDPGLIPLDLPPFP